MLFSVLIPTYNRLPKLRMVLEELQKQPRIAEGEVIVGIDGSQDGTKEFLEDYQHKFRGQLSFFWIPNSGRAVIRNRLMEKASGDLLIFIQDDIVVTAQWLNAHLQAHEKQAGAVVGHMTWYPKAEITPYMRWLEHGGHLLNFRGLRDGDVLDFWHFYTGNISLPRKLLGDLRFDESFKTYGWEDIVFGYEWAKRGHKIFYSEQALAWHWDEYREEDLPDYMEKLAIGAACANQKYPDAGFVPPLWKRMILQSMIAAGALFWLFLPQRVKWYLSMKKEFLKNLPNSV